MAKKYRRMVARWHCNYLGCKQVRFTVEKQLLYVTERASFLYLNKHFYWLCFYFCIILFTTFTIFSLFLSFFTMLTLLFPIFHYFSLFFTIFHYFSLFSLLFTIFHYFITSPPTIFHNIFTFPTIFSSSPIKTVRELDCRYRLRQDLGWYSQNLLRYIFDHFSGRGT